VQADVYRKAKLKEQAINASQAIERSEPFIFVKPETNASRQ
jgi:hypothetical protein